MNNVESMAQVIVRLQEEIQILNKEKAELIQENRQLKDKLETWMKIATTK